jgi:hypothetical protein
MRELKINMDCVLMKCRELHKKLEPESFVESNLLMVQKAVKSNHYNYREFLNADTHG